MLTLTELMDPSISTFSFSFRLISTGCRSNSLLLLVKKKINKNHLLTSLLLPNCAHRKVHRNFQNCPAVHTDSGITSGNISPVLPVLAHIFVPPRLSLFTQKCLHESELARPAADYHKAEKSGGGSVFELATKLTWPPPRACCDAQPPERRSSLDIERPAVWPSLRSGRGARSLSAGGEGTNTSLERLSQSAASVETPRCRDAITAQFNLQ